MKKLFVLILSMCMVLTASVALGESVKVGTNAEFPPFEFIADDGSIQGFDIELISAILDLAGIEYTVESMEFDALPAALAAGQIDIAIAGMTISEEKGKSVLFSEPYFSATQKIIVLSDSHIKTVEDIKAGMKIGVQLGTTGDIYVTDSMEGIVCERYSKALDAIMDPVSLFDPVYSDGGDALCVMDQVRDAKNTDDSWLERIALKEAISRLGERERKILAMRFFQGKTQMEVSAEVGISQAQVSRLEKSAIQQIRKNL